MRQAQDLLVLRRDEQDGHPSRGKRVDQLVDRPLGADVDATRRLVGDEDAAAAGTATSRTAPSAGCRRTASPPARRVPSRGRRRGASASTAARRSRRAERRRPADLTEMGQRDVVDDRAQHQQALCLRGPPAAARCPRRSRRAASGCGARSPSSVDLAGVGRSAPKIALATSDRRCRSGRRGRRSRRRGRRTTRSSTAAGTATARAPRARPAHRRRAGLLREDQLHRTAEHGRRRGGRASPRPPALSARACRREAR